MNYGLLSSHGRGRDWLALGDGVRGRVDLPVAGLAERRRKEEGC